MATYKNNQPLPGVAVVVEGSTIGAITNNEGIYELPVPADDLNVNYI